MHVLRMEASLPQCRHGAVYSDALEAHGVQFKDSRGRSGLPSNANEQSHQL